MSDALREDDDASWLKAELRSLLSGVNLVVLILAIAAGVWGSFDTLTDAAGDRFWGNLAVAAPGIYAGWCMLEIAWTRLASISTLLLRLLTSCFIAPAFVALPIALILAIGVAFPGVREIIADAQTANHGFHYWWSEGIASQLFLVPLAGYVIGMCVPLGVLLIITMPVISLRAPHIAAEGSHLEQVSEGQRSATTAFVFCGLGATTLGIGLWLFGNGGSIAEFPEALGRFLYSASYGHYYWGETVWLFGVVFVVIGVALMAWGSIRVVSARVRGARD